MKQLTLLCNTNEADCLEVVGEHHSVSIECVGDNVIVLNAAKVEKLVQWLDDWLEEEQS